MKYLPINGLPNKIYIFDEKDELCSQCSYPLDMGRCHSCNIFYKYRKSTGGQFYFDRVLSIGKYRQMKMSEKPSEESKDIMTWLIVRYKSNKKMIPFCGELLKLKINTFLEELRIPKEKVVICSIPDYGDKRNYKKADLLAEDAANKTNIKFCPVLRKTKEIKQQHQIKNIEEKFTNVKDAFSIDFDQVKIIEGKIVLLVDDVVSSMATMNECSKILKQVGAKKIYGFSLGRNILPPKGEVK